MINYESYNYDFMIYHIINVCNIIASEIRVNDLTFGET